MQFDNLEHLVELTLPFLERHTVGLSGGSTYRFLYPAWVSAQPAVGQTSFYPVDERAVPFDHADSNWGMVDRLMLLGTNCRRRRIFKDKHRTLKD